MFRKGHVGRNKADDDGDIIIIIIFITTVTGTIYTAAVSDQTGVGRQIYLVWHGTLTHVMADFVLPSFKTLVNNTASSIRQLMSSDTSMSSLAPCCVLVFVATV